MFISELQCQVDLYVVLGACGRVNCGVCFIHTPLQSLFEYLPTPTFRLYSPGDIDCSYDWQLVGGKKVALASLRFIPVV